MASSTRVYDTPASAPVAPPAPPAPTRRTDPGVDSALAPPRPGFLARLRGDRTTMVALALLTIVVAGSILAPLLSPLDAERVQLDRQLQAPSLLHPFGSDDLGRDVFVRVMRGGRQSLAVGVLAMLVSLLLSAVAGGVAGYYGGFFDGALMRIADVLLSLPLFLVVLFVAGAATPGIAGLCLLIGLTQWMEPARIVRAVVLTTRQNAYVEAARASGAGDGRILFYHILRHASGPALAGATIVFAHALMLESAISFLGYGVQPPAASWGAMLSGAQSHLSSAPWLAVFPGLMIFTSVLCVHVIGDFLRRTLAPAA